MSKRKPILALEFDGVIHEFISPWENAWSIQDGPVPGVLEFLYEAQEYFQLVLVSPRLADDRAIPAIQQWLEDFGFPYLELWVNPGPPPAFLTISSRALQFTGKFPNKPKRLLGFRPWNKGGGNFSPNRARDALQKLYDAAMLNQQTAMYDPEGSAISLIDDSVLLEVAQVLRET